jgi:hypothetical protein
MYQATQPQVKRRSIMSPFGMSWEAFDKMDAGMRMGTVESYCELKGLDWKKLKDACPNMTSAELQAFGL